MTRSTDQLLLDIEAFIVARGLSATAFGALAMGDRHLVRRLRRGGSVTLDTADGLRLFMATYGQVSRRRARGNVPGVAA